MVFPHLLVTDDDNILSYCKCSAHSYVRIDELFFFSSNLTVESQDVGHVVCGIEISMRKFIPD